MKKIIINAGKIGLINIFTNFYLIHTPLEINYMTFIQALTFPDHSELSEHFSSLLSIPKVESHSVSEGNTDKHQKWVSLRCYWHIVLLLHLKMFLLKKCPYASFFLCSDLPEASELCFGFLLFLFSFLGEETSLPNSWVVQNWELDSGNKKIKCALENHNKYFNFNHKSIIELKMDNQ